MSACNIHAFGKIPKLAFGTSLLIQQKKSRPHLARCPVAPWCLWISRCVDVIPKQQGKQRYVSKGHRSATMVWEKSLIYWTRKPWSCVWYFWGANRRNHRADQWPVLNALHMQVRIIVGHPVVSSTVVLMLMRRHICLCTQEIQPIEMVYIDESTCWQICLYCANCIMYVMPNLYYITYLHKYVYIYICISVYIFKYTYLYIYVCVCRKYNCTIIFAYFNEDQILMTANSKIQPLLPHFHGGLWKKFAKGCHHHALRNVTCMTDEMEEGGMWQQKSRGKS